MRLFFCTLFLFFHLGGQSAYAKLTINDLGINQEEIKVDPLTIHAMEVREEKLQIHQKLGLATMVAMTTTIILSDLASKNEPKKDTPFTANNVKRNDAHQIAGMATGLLYWTTAYFLLSAPKPIVTIDSGASQLHRSLAWVHAPLMAIVPVLGYIHNQNDRKGIRSTGIVNAHDTLAKIAYISLMSAGLTMVFDF